MAGGCSKAVREQAWLLVYGGDMAKEGVPDVGLLVQRLAATSTCRVMAPSVSSAADPPPPQPFVNYYYVMEPQYEGDLEGARQQQLQQQQGQPPLSNNITRAHSHGRDTESCYAGKRGFVEEVGDNTPNEDVNERVNQRRRLGDYVSLQQQESVPQQPPQAQDGLVRTETAGSKDHTQEEQPVEGASGSPPGTPVTDRVLTGTDDTADAPTRDRNASGMSKTVSEPAPEPRADRTPVPIRETSEAAGRQLQQQQQQQQQQRSESPSVPIKGAAGLEFEAQGCREVVAVAGDNYGVVLSMADPSVPANST
ncbi:hypothetical protein Vafri_11896 [Volvox africanus]|uniref:Uncharacterized protein n=1 Tax=Volvox africanus TaxID=51714 RepID=A0A8J4B8W6_9CHLO|nr:hypothetical protein Vafri_11896 [Volvox africanus]